VHLTQFISWSQPVLFVVLIKWCLAQQRGSGPGVERLELLPLGLWTQVASHINVWVGAVPISKCEFPVTRVRACLDVFTQELGALANAIDPQLTSVLALERHRSREVFSLLIGILHVILFKCCSALLWMAWPPWYLLALLGSTQHLALA
jgi:hypothetical protein